MARPLPVNMLLAGTGAVLLVSGLGGEPIGKVLQGSFGKLQVNSRIGDKENEPAQSGASAESGGGGMAESPSPSSFSSATVAPSPQTFRRPLGPKREAESIAAILLGEGITNPTHAQIERARELYHRK